MTMERTHPRHRRILWPAALMMALAAGGAMAQANSLETTAGAGLLFGTGASSPTAARMQITQAGNVGIGIAPTKAVEVSGTVSATAVYSKGALVSIPVGVILPWHKSMSGVPGLPSEWVECNGQTISDATSPMNGQTVPNLNGQVYAGSKGYYLRGGSTSGNFNASTYMTGNGTKYNFGSGSGSYYGIGYGWFNNYEDGAGPASTYGTGDNTLGTRRFQVAAMTMVYIMKIK